MKNIIAILVTAGLITVFPSCYYDKAELLYPSTLTGCDTTSTVTYSAKVVPILQQQCYGCHSIASPAGNIAMSTYATDKVIALNGKLYGSISHSSGYSPMPKSGNKLSNCQIAIIKKWIDAGSPNN